MNQPIRVYTPDMTLLDETDNYISLQFMPKFYDVGSFELHINEYVEGSEYFQKGNIIVLNKRFDKAMIIRHREIQLDESGRASENWKITGVTLEGILDKRVTIPPSHTSHDRISGSAEKVMKHYVDNHFVNPNESKRKIEQIEIAPNRNRGEYVKWESRYKNVSEELSKIAKQGNIGWVMYADMERKKWVFDVVEPRDDTKDNKEGLQPVFFSPDFSTIKSQSFVDSNTNYKNVGYVGGQGEGVDRKIIKLGDGEGLERSEVFIDARDVGSEDEEEEEKELTDEEIEQQLIERGQEKMREFETTFYLEAQILTPSIHGRENTFSMSTPFEYEKDFRLGDTVEVFNKKWRIKMKAPITEFKEVHEHGGFTLEATFGEAQPTLITKIKEKFDEMDGIEKQELPAKLAVMRMKEAMGYSDQRITEEEKARIKQAQENLALSLQKAQQAKDESVQYINEYTYDRHTIDAKDSSVYQDSTYYSDRVAQVEAQLAEEQAKAYADGKVTQEEQARINAVQQALNEAKADAEQKSGLAERRAVEYADTNKTDKREVIDTINRSPETTLIDFPRLKIENEIEAKHIKSLAGLNINDQFVVDSNGNVSIGNDSTTIDREGVTVKDGSFLLEDDTTRNPYSVKPGQNLIKDHSFELVKGVFGSRTDYAKHNWMDMYDAEWYEDVRTSWQIKYGNPKVATIFAPDKPEAMPMFGEKAIVIKLNNTVWQNVWNASGGTTYTLSAFFRRHWNVKPGGKPAFSVVKLNNLGERVERLARKEFPAVKDDYSISWYSLTFTTPTDMAVDEALEIVIWSSVDRWVQCD